jgi:hypothetical protein
MTSAASSPLDSVVCVDTEAELLAAMNASNGCLVASFSTHRLGYDKTEVEASTRDRLFRRATATGI